MMASLLPMMVQGAGVAAGEAPPPPASTCDSPVYMVVAGPTLDRDRMIAYAQAIAESGLYRELGGYYVTIPRPLEVFEGELPANYANLTVRFPCIENARKFWNSRVYQEEIIKLRQNPSAGDYTVTIYAEAPLREDMVGRVGDARYSADFSGVEVLQVDPPVVGPFAKEAAE